jgi:hypothetical protein
MEAVTSVAVEPTLGYHPWCIGILTGHDKCRDIVRQAV